MSYFIIIRGPLGCGKSTIAKEIGKELNAINISIDEVLAENKLDDVDSKIGCIPAKNFIKANELMMQQARKNLDEGKIVVFDACFYHKEAIIDLIRRLPYKNFTFDLKAPIEVCIERDKNRPISYGEEAVASVYRLVSRFDYGIAVDSSKTIKKSITEILSHLPKGMMQIKYKELVLEIAKDVYEPSEDSFLLAGAADKTKEKGEILEMGCGSGLSLLICAKNGAKNVLGLDISLEAVKCASENAKRNKVTNATFKVSDMFEKAGDKKFDLIIFNPPYLPTEYNEKIKGPLNHAFDGGKDGRKVLNIFLEQFSKYLKSTGSLLLVQSDLNGPIKTKRRLKELGYQVKVVAKESFPFETVYIYKAKRKECQ